MNCTVLLDWKFAAVVSATVVGVCLVSKLDAEGAKEVAMRLADAFDGKAIALSGC